MQADRSLASRAVGAFAPLSVALLTLVSTGCAARVTQFHDFAAAGVSYQKAADTALDDAGTAAIRANNANLVTARPNRAALPSTEREDDVKQHNGLLQKRLAILRDLRRHGRVLQRYFQALAASGALLSAMAASAWK